MLLPYQLTDANQVVLPASAMMNPTNISRHVESEPGLRQGLEAVLWGALELNYEVMGLDRLVTAGLRPSYLALADELDRWSNCAVTREEQSARMVVAAARCDSEGRFLTRRGHPVDGDEPAMVYSSIMLKAWRRPDRVRYYRLCGRGNGTAGVLLYAVSTFAEALALDRSAPQLFAGFARTYALLAYAQEFVDTGGRLLDLVELWDDGRLQDLVDRLCMPGPGNNDSAVRLYAQKMGVEVVGNPYWWDRVANWAMEASYHGSGLDRWLQILSATAGGQRPDLPLRVQSAPYAHLQPLAEVADEVVSTLRERAEEIQWH